MDAKGDFSVKVSKKEVVAATLPLQEHWLPLSNLDLLLPPLDVGVFFCYKKPAGGHHPTTTFGSMAGILKEALAQALVSYYAFAGEVVENAVGEPELLCNNRGVDFMEAVADVKLRDLNLYNPDESIEGKLVPKKKKGVFSIQATGLKCGGLVVACTFDHRVADAYSANMFLVSWAEIAQFKLPSQMPSFRRSLVGPRRPGRYHSSIDRTYVPVSALPPPKDHCSGSGNYQPISRIYYLNQLQSIASSVSGARINNGVRCKRSKLEALSAFLWKLVAGYQKDMGDNKVCKMGIVVDGRARLSEGDGKAKPKLIAEYFGNVLSIPFGEMRSEALDGKELSSVADAVHQFLESALTKEHFLGLIDWVEAHRPEPMLAKIYATGIDEGPAVVVSSGARFPVEKVDFGWGGPIFGSYHFPWGGEARYVMPMPSPMGNGDWVVYMHIPAAITGYIFYIKSLSGTNFRKWKEQISIILGVMDLDYALRVDAPAALTAESSTEQKAAYEKWERSNRISLMIMKGSITTAIRGAILDLDNAKLYLAHIEEQFQGSSKAHATTLITKMVTLKYSGSNGVREHILRMNDMASQLKGLDMEISKGFLVHFIMTSLPAQFGPFKINYNTQKEKWKMSELISMCIQEEERLKSEQPDSAHVAITGPSKGKGKGKKFGKGNVQGNKSASVTKTDKASSSGTKGSSGP
ncbi:hypothetical protein RJ639_006902, partial [Escallonia herrerae]